MDASQLSKLSYVSRHVDELFEQRVEQFDSLYDSQVNWLQEFVQGKEANLKEQLEVLQTPKSKYPRRNAAPSAAPTPMKEFQYQPAPVQPLRVPFTPLRGETNTTSNLPTEKTVAGKIGEQPFKTPSTRTTRRSTAAAAAAAVAEEKEKVEETKHSQQEFKAPVAPRRTFKRTAKNKEESPAPEAQEPSIESTQTEKKDEPVAATVESAEAAVGSSTTTDNIIMPPPPSRAGTLRGDAVEESATLDQASEIAETPSEASLRSSRSAAARRGAFRKKASSDDVAEEANSTPILEEPVEAAPVAPRGRSTRSKKTAAVEVETVAPEAKPKRGRPKKAATAAPVVDVVPESPVRVERETQKLDEDADKETKVEAQKKRKISETAEVDVPVAAQLKSPEGRNSFVLSKTASPTVPHPDEIELHEEPEKAKSPVKQDELPTVVVAEAVFTPASISAVSDDKVESEKKRRRSSTETLPASEIKGSSPATTPVSASKRRKVSEVNASDEILIEPQTPPPAVPTLPVSNRRSTEKALVVEKQESPVVQSSTRISRSKSPAATSARPPAQPPSYAESLALLRKELPEIEAVLRLDREEAEAAATSSVLAEAVQPSPAKVQQKEEASEVTTECEAMEVEETAVEEVEPERLTNAKRKRSSADSIASSSATSSAPTLFSESSEGKRMAGNSIASAAGSTRAAPQPKTAAVGKTAAAPKGAVDEKLKKVIENRQQKEQERLQKQLEKIKKQEEKQARLNEQKKTSTVQEKLIEAQRRKEELKKKQQEKKKAAAPAAPALAKKPSAEELAVESVESDGAQENATVATKATPQKSGSAKFSSTAVPPAPALATANPPVPQAVKDTPSKGSSIKSIFAALNPLALLSFGSAKKQKPQDEPSKTSAVSEEDDDSNGRRNSAPGSPSVSKSPLFAADVARSPSRASTGSNHGAFDEPPSSAKKSKKKSKTPAKKVKSLFGWNKPSTIVQPTEPLPVPHLPPPQPFASTAKKINLSPSDLPSPGPAPTISKSTADIMPPPKGPAIGSPTWIKMHTKSASADQLQHIPKPSSGSPYQSPEKTKPTKFHQSPEFQYKIDEYSSDQDSPEKMMGPEWTKKEQLWEALIRQSSMDPDDIFGTDFPKTCDLAEIFGGDKLPAEQRRRYRHRTSSGNWTRDKLHPHEDKTYKKKMGYYESPSK